MVVDAFLLVGLFLIEKCFKVFSVRSVLYFISPIYFSSFIDNEV